MGRVDPPTQEELLEMARDPEAARRAVERWGMDALMNPGAPEQRGTGLGDMIAKITSAVGVKPCKPCEERRKKLNRWRIGGG
jgi:hypothetical protein